MVKFRLLAPLFFLLLLSFSTLGSKSSPNLIQKSLGSEKIKLKRITKEIESIEKQLDRSNKKFLTIGGKKRTLEESLYGLKKELLSSMANLSSGKNEMRKVLTTIAVNTLEGETGPESLLTKKILVGSLKKRLKEYNLQIKETQEQQDKLNRVESQFKLHESKEQMLLQTIANLEESKRLQAQSYMESKKRYQEFLNSWQTLKVKRTNKKSGNNLREKLGTFFPPLEKHTRLDFRKKGVTFLFDERQPVKAGRGGKVIHKGSLSTYGNVIMLDHGNETISVCLGDFQPKVEKGMSVKVGDVLGYTKKTRGKQGKLYFEVREKDKAQPTIHLLDDKALASAGKIRS